MKRKLKNYNVDQVINKLYQWSYFLDQMTAEFLVNAGYGVPVAANYLGVSERTVMDMVPTGPSPYGIAGIRWGVRR